MLVVVCIPPEYSVLPYCWYHSLLELCCPPHFLRFVLSPRLPFGLDRLTASDITCQAYLECRLQSTADGTLPCPSFNVLFIQWSLPPHSFFRVPGLALKTQICRRFGPVALVLGGEPRDTHLHYDRNWAALRPMMVVDTQTRTVVHTIPNKREPWDGPTLAPCPKTWNRSGLAWGMG